MRAGPRGTETAFRVVVPNRVDLAGGTLDIYPVYLLVEGAVTVNAAISVRSVVEARPLPGGGVRVHSGNFGSSVAAADTHGVPLYGELGLLGRALRHYPPASGLELRVLNEAPVGSGIGASSALLVALMVAMGRLTGRSASWKRTALAAMEVEASHLRGLTGRQDHLAALRGGILGIRFLPGDVDVRRLSPGGTAGRMLRNHGVLAYTGIAHRSSDVNWRMVRGAIEGESAALRKFRGIAASARDAWSALAGAEPDALGGAVGAEWRIRRTLAKGVSPGRVDALFSRRSFRAVVSGAKLCGAGGGGMVFAMLRDPDARRRAETMLREAGMTVVPFRPSGGIRIEPIDGD